MAATQDHLSIQEIQGNLLLLKDGGASLVLKTSAVNFGLLSEEEQVAIIFSFAGMLNSLSFPIQIVIRSERLDVSAYVDKLELAARKQYNPLLSRLIGSYKEFVRSVIKDNEVLDKQFYVVINATYPELGVLTRTSEDKIKKANILLYPRRDHISRQLNRVGLKARQLTSFELVKLFYDIYNGQDQQSQASVVATSSVIASEAKPASPAKQGERSQPLGNNTKPITINRMSPSANPYANYPQVRQQAQGPRLQRATPPQPIMATRYNSSSLPAYPPPRSRSPFVVEELAE